MTVALETIGLEKRFGGLKVTQDLSLRIEQGARQPLTRDRRLKPPCFGSRNRAMPRHMLIRIVEPVAVEREQVIDSQTRAHEPTLRRALHRQHELERIDHVRRNLLPHAPLLQRLANEPELERLEVTQAPVHQLRRPRRRPARKITLLDEGN